MSSNGGEGEQNERKIRDMMGLVKFCLEATAKEDAQGTTPSIGPMDPERRAWLEQAIRSMTVDTTKMLLDNLSFVKETIEKMRTNPNDSIDIDKTCGSIQVLTDLCEEIDLADDFAKLNGFSIFQPLISCKHDELVVKACELIAALAQNNPNCQGVALHTRLLEKLLDYVAQKESIAHVKARSYALYAISSIVRASSDVWKHFETSVEGLSVLLQLLDCEPIEAGDSCQDSNSPVYWQRKLRIRSLFLFKNLVTESARVAEYFCSKDIVVKLSRQIKPSVDFELLEHLLNALKTFLESISSDERSRMLAPVPELKQSLQTVMERASQAKDSDYDVGDVIATCRELSALV